jgi:peptidase YpeB-like protein
MKTRRMKIAAGIAALAAFALGGAAIAGAGGAFDNEESLKGQELARASAAALKATGGGTVNATERDSEKGAVYEVEVTKNDGSTVDVRLDGSYGVVAIDTDSETNDSGDTGEDAGE